MGPFLKEKFLFICINVLCVLAATRICTWTDRHVQKKTYDCSRRAPVYEYRFEVPPAVLLRPSHVLYTFLLAVRVVAGPIPVLRPVGDIYYLFIFLLIYVGIY